MTTLYLCAGCGQVHDDNDYCKEDGDVKITDKNLLLAISQKNKRGIKKMITGDILNLLKFLRARRRTLQHTRQQVVFNKRIKNTDEAQKVLRGHLKEIERMIRKLQTVGLEKMIEKEISSCEIILEKKKKAQIKLGIIPDKHDN